MAVIHSATCEGQVNTNNESFRDSLYRHISREVSAEFACRFAYLKGSSVIHPDLGDNATQLQQLRNFIRLALSYPEYTVSRIRLIGYSSIEGTYTYNENLSRDRVQQFGHYLRMEYPELNWYHQQIESVPEDWEELTRLIRISTINDRKELLEIINSVPGVDDREAKMLRLNGGAAYQTMYQTLFPLLRRVEVRVEYKAGRSPSAPAGHLPLAGEELHAASHRYKFALKTNMLLWAGVQRDLSYTTPVANVALEYYLTRSWSLEVGAMYSYWRYNSNREFQGISGYRLEFRKYLSLISSERFKLYFGPYVRFGDYDLQFASQTSIDNGQLTIDNYNTHAALDRVTRTETTAQPIVNCQLSTVNLERSTVNYTGNYRDAGLSAGLTFRLVGGLGIELGARAGYVKTKRVKYGEGGENEYESTAKYNKVRITDTNISLNYKFR